MPLQKFKRGGHFCVLTGMWVFQNITLHRETNSAMSRNKIRLAFHFVERNYKILDRDWFPGRLFVTSSARNQVGVQLQVSDLN